MKMKITLMMGLIIALAATSFLFAVEHDYASGVVNQNAGIYPGDGFGGAPDSAINNYLHQDEQINLNANSGLVKVLRTDQKINTNKFVTDFVQFRHATPRELRHVFRTICRKEGGNADVLQDKVKKEYFMQVVCPEFQLPYLRKAAEELDVPWLKVAEEGECHLYYQAKFRPIQDVLWISQYYRGPEGFFEIDDANNALYFNDQLACEGLQNWGLSQIDIPPNQVRLDVTVYEVNTQSDAKIGVDFIDFKNGPGRNLFEGVFTHYHDNLRCKHIIDVIDGSCSPDDVYYSKGKHDADYRYTNVHAIATAEFVDFLKVKGKARELIKTTLMAQSGHAVIAGSTDRVLAIGAMHPSEPSQDETPVYEASEQYEMDSVVPCPESGVVSSLPQQHYRWLKYTQDASVGVQVSLMPFIGLESMELEIGVDASSVVGEDASGNPVIDRRAMDTKIRLKDGEPFVIGGLKRKHVVKRTAKVPLLGSIPILGWAFGQEINTDHETNVVVVVEPKFIIGTDSDMEIPQEMRTTIAQAEGVEEIQIPKTGWGFDQWLLDSEK